jgi:hypothetical protein
MERKKVEKSTLVNESPKKRTENKEKSGLISYGSNDTKVKWDKIKGVGGKIVRYKQSEELKRREELTNKKYRQLYVGIDGNELYFYYEVFG